MNEQLKPKKCPSTNYKGRNYNELKAEAQVLYIKQGLSADAICKQLDISMVTMGKWVKTEKWASLRPDMEVLKQYKAADLYIVKGMTIGEICQQLSLSEITIKAWIDINGWETAKLISQASDVTAEIVNAFCLYFKGSFPKYSSEIEFTQSSYIKSIAPLT